MAPTPDPGDPVESQIGDTRRRRVNFHTFKGTQPLAVLDGYGRHTQQLLDRSHRPLLYASFRAANLQPGLTP